jgi:hypothetical protein
LGNNSMQFLEKMVLVTFSSMGIDISQSRKQQEGQWITSSYPGDSLRYPQRYHQYGLLTPKTWGWNREVNHGQQNYKKQEEEGFGYLNHYNKSKSWERQEIPKSGLGKAIWVKCWWEVRNATQIIENDGY